MHLEAPRGGRCQNAFWRRVLDAARVHGNASLLHASDIYGVSDISRAARDYKVLHSDSLNACAHTSTGMVHDTLSRLPPLLAPLIAQVYLVVARGTHAGW